MYCVCRIGHNILKTAKDECAALTRLYGAVCSLFVYLFIRSFNCLSKRDKQMVTLAGTRGN